MEGKQEELLRLNLHSVECIDASLVSNDKSTANVSILEPTNDDKRNHDIKKIMTIIMVMIVLMFAHR